MTKDTIDAGTVMASVGNTRVQPSFVQKAGLWLAAGVGIVITSVTAGVVYFLISHHPDTPTLETLKSFAPDTKQGIEQYKELSAISVKSAQDLFQTVVTQALLPVCTAILGYIFAKGNDGNS